MRQEHNQGSGTVYPMDIRVYREHDWDQVWPIIAAVFRAGETYAFSPDITEREARRVWVESPLETYVATNPDDRVVATYFIKPNQPALGAHVCNCGYIVAEEARGQGIAGRLCEHSQQVALRLGFRAMQYNLVVATNEGAIRVWRSQGFGIVGVLPNAFNSRSAGYVDALVMYKELA